MDRIQRKLAATGVWEPLDALYLELAAISVVAYVRQANAGMAPAQLEPLRVAARHAMALMLWIDPTREHLALLDGHGRDF